MASGGGAAAGAPGAPGAAARVYVGGIPACASEADLEAYLRRYVRPRNLAVSRAAQRALDQLEGVPFCAFFDVDPGEAARVLQLDGCWFKGGRIRVQRARRPAYEERVHPWDEAGEGGAAGTAGAAGGPDQPGGAAGAPAEAPAPPWVPYRAHRIPSELLDRKDFPASEGRGARDRPAAGAQAGRRPAPRAQPAPLAPAPIINKRRPRVLPL